MTATVPRDSTAVQNRAFAYFQSAAMQQNASVDRMMAWLLGFEWAGMIIFAAFSGPYTWTGGLRNWNPHFLAAVLAGPAFILPSIALALLYSGRQFTRHAVAVAQMLVSVVLIGLTNGRIETHFHVFGSLAFLSFYRDWRVVVTASAVAAIDHVARGIWLPLSVYGVAMVNPYRWLEHIWWVVFEDFFLFLAIGKGVAESNEIARGKSLLYEGSYHDVLTGLANRRFLSEQFESYAASEPAASKALFFIDLDRFKQANDLHGHTVGDKLLVEVAARLMASVPSDAVLARIGGDEFNVLLPHSMEKDASETGSRLLQSLAAPFFIDGHYLLLSATVGIALYPEHGTTLISLQERADQAMYAAKANGRNQVALYRLEDTLRKSRVEDISRDLFQAQANGEFHLRYQPLIDNKGQVSGFEALLRWDHPKHGSMPPAEFIPIAERSGVIIPIGEWVLAEACRQCGLWQNQPNPLGVSVNVSAVQFEQAGFPLVVRSILSQTELNPSLLTLELTESVLIRDVAKARSHLDNLRSIGVTVSLDDFGTGYSSLSYLSELPADSIKLDRSFVQREFRKPSSVVESIVEMAHRIGLRVIAEGVESQEEADWLLSLKCDELQGYKFSRPIPAVLVLQYLATRLAAASALEPQFELANVA